MKLVAINIIYPDWGSSYEKYTFFEYSSLEDYKADIKKYNNLQDEISNEEKLLKNRWNEWRGIINSYERQIASFEKKIERAEKQKADMDNAPMWNQGDKFNEIYSDLCKTIKVCEEKIAELEKVELPPEPPVKSEKVNDLIPLKLVFWEDVKIMTLDDFFEEKKIE